jgi:hypothetical protein
MMSSRGVGLRPSSLTEPDLKISLIRLFIVTHFAGQLYRSGDLRDRPIFYQREKEKRDGGKRGTVQGNEEMIEPFKSKKKCQAKKTKAKKTCHEIGAHRTHRRHRKWQ